MTKDKEFWRYTFAGQIFAARHAPWDREYKERWDFDVNADRAIEAADALLAALEASEPKECEHEWFVVNQLADKIYWYSECKKCGCQK